MDITSGSPDPSLPVPLAQHPMFAAALRDIGRSAEVLTLKDGARFVAQVLIVRRTGFGRLGLTVRGPCWAQGITSGDKTASLQALRRYGLRMVEAESGCDAASLRAAGYRRILTPAHVALLDLTGSAADRRAAATVKWRNRLRRAEHAGLRLDAGVFDGRADHWFLRAEAAQRRERGYRALPIALTTAFARAYPGMARLFVASASEAPLAAMLFLRHGPIATYHIGWSGDSGRRCHAHALLLTHAADWLAQRGHALLDLGTVDTEAGAGLARFKIGAGAQVRALGGSWLRLPGLG